MVKVFSELPRSRREPDGESRASRCKAPADWPIVWLLVLTATFGCHRDPSWNNPNVPRVSSRAKPEAGQFSTLPAFPGAVGFGALATGGRGGKVLKVTTLAATGPGSLHAALSETGPRIVTFAVSGVIEGDVFEIESGDVTIAGQTAPGGGITIRGRLYGAWDATVGNIVVRHLRVRPKYDGSRGSEFDAVQFSRNHTVILDHVSASFAVDENVDLYSTRNVTVQWCTIESAATAGHEEGPHNYGLIHGPDGGAISVHHNLFVNQANRNPAIANGPAEVFNNVMHNVRIGFVHHNPATGPFNIIGNYFKAGPSSELIPVFFDDENRSPAGGLAYYVGDNWVDAVNSPCGRGPLTNPWAQCKHDLVRDVSHRSARPFVFDGLGGYEPGVATSPHQAYAEVLERAGAFPRDIVTRNAIADVRRGSGTWGAREPADLMAGLRVTVAPADNDEDGMADEWELRHGFNPQEPNDRHALMPSGYTAVEQYLNELAERLIR